MKSLQDILNRKREIEDRESRPKLDWFSLKDGSVKVQFLQELGDEAPNYNKDRGKAVYLVEHVSPYDFRKKALCTYESDGRCWACEMNQEETSVELDDGKGNKVVKNYPWSQKTNMYIYLITEHGDVKVLSWPAPGSVFDLLYQFAEEENDGSITGQTFAISKGPQRNDKWSLMPSKKEIPIPDDLALVNLEEAVGFKVEYEKQKSFYLPEDKGTNTEAKTVAEPVGKSAAW